MYDENYACPHCNAYMLDHPELKEWKKCPGCGYCTKSGKKILYLIYGADKDETDNNK